MKILLIHPRLENDFYESVNLPPLGVAFIAGVLRKNHHDVTIIDDYFSKNKIHRFAKTIVALSPDIIGVSVTTPLAKTALEISAFIKTINKNIKIIFGGVHPTLFPKETVENESVDYVVYGEGEETITELLAAIERSCDLSRIPGIAYKDNGQAVITSTRSLIRDLDSIPFPAYDLLPMRKYSSPQLSQRPFSSMMTSRGCPYRCIYCDAHVVFGRTYRFYSPCRVMDEIQYLIDTFHVKGLMFKDSEFTLNVARVEQICDLMIRDKTPVQWCCNGRVGGLNMGILKKMKKAGCRLIQYGVESGDQKILDILKKQITIEQVKQTFQMSKKAGLKTAANFMVGNPHENQESLVKTRSLIKEINPDYCNFTFITPFPGTELYRMARENNWLIDDLDCLSMKLDQCVMNATEISVGELKQAKAKLFQFFYLRPAYIFKKIFTMNIHEWKMNVKGFWQIMCMKVK